MSRSRFGLVSKSVRSIRRLRKRAHDTRSATLTRLTSFVLAGLLTAAVPSYAQTKPEDIPKNAQPKGYIDGWECNGGFRQSGDECIAVVVPQNAYATNRTYGEGWECLHGFRQVDDISCTKIVVPQGGFLDPSGDSWSCLRGFTELNSACLKIVLPANAYLTNNSFGSLWQCERGYQKLGEICAEIALPANAFLNESRYGQPWTCERGFRDKGTFCEAVIVPANAFFDDATYGPGWKCDRGFAPSETECLEIELPDNAHFDRSGNRWECHRSYQRFEERCILNDR